MLLLYVSKLLQIWPHICITIPSILLLKRNNWCVHLWPIPNDVRWGCGNRPYTKGCMEIQCKYKWTRCARSHSTGSHRMGTEKKDVETCYHGWWSITTNDWVAVPSQVNRTVNRCDRVNSGSVSLLEAYSPLRARGDKSREGGEDMQWNILVDCTVIQQHGTSQNKVIQGYTVAYN